MKVISATDPEAIRDEVKCLPVGEALAIRTDLSPDDCAVMAQALGQEWKMAFCQARGLGVIWTRGSALDVKIVEHPLEFYVDMIEAGDPFSFLRYGDMLAGVAGTLYPGYGFQRFTPDLVADIRRSLLAYYRGPRYLMGLAPLYHLIRMRAWGHIARFLQANHLDEIEWVGTEVFNRALRAGELWPFIRALRNTSTLVIGPPKLALLAEKGILPDATFLPIPPRECHAQIYEIERAVLAQRLPAVIVVSAGPAAVVLIHRLFPIIGQHSTMISAGSLWGPFISIPEHRDHRNLTDEVMQRNLGRGGKMGEDG